MSEPSSGAGVTPIQATQLTIRLWHPDCWTLRATAEVGGGLVAHGVYHTDGVASARCTAYADSRAEIAELIAAVSDSPLTDRVKRVHEQFNPALRGNPAAGNTTEELLVEYRSRDSIHDAFVQRGFVPEAPIRIHGGEEYWTVIITQDRTEIQRRLDDIGAEEDAEITVEGMKSPETPTSHAAPTARLSERQREVFRLAQREGYYTWPRHASADDLATELGLSKTTVLEHLRKAEAKLLGSL
jgi:hypothetical protein